ncbi:MAG: metallophosphoesterase family protein [Ruminococcus sp.]|nr:metallophosphoesterase family protein [Ruminococcus sp.]
MPVIIFLLAVLAESVYGITEYYRTARAFKFPRTAFALILIALFGITVMGALHYKAVPTAFLRAVCVFTASFFAIAFLYSGILFIIRYAVCKIFSAAGIGDTPVGRFLSQPKKYGIAVLAAVFMLTVVGYVNMGIVRETEYEVKIDKPSQNDKLTAAVISDTHVGVGLFKSRLDDLTEQVNALSPDVIFLVGDIIDENSRPEEIAAMTEAFSGFKSRYGTYFVFGNHETYISEDVRHYFEDAGITVLEDDAVTIAGDIQIIGRSDSYSSDKELSQVVDEEGTDLSKPLIVLNHEPLRLSQMGEQGADVIFCGHTHGEQFPLSKPLVAAANDMVYGKKDFSGAQCITTSGAAGWGFHFKLPSKSEILKVEFTFD